ncbi:hypothetical protein C0J52_11147, partial [Blattella germanica]
DITLATWNVRTLERPGKLKELRSELDKYGVKIAALQELRWRGEGMMVSGQHILMYSGLEEEINKVQRHDVKMILGDLNAKIGREEVYRHVIGKESLHKDSNDNGLRLIDFASGKQMIIKSTWHPRKNINKETWISPEEIK